MYQLVKNKVAGERKTGEGPQQQLLLLFTRPHHTNTFCSPCLVGHGIDASRGRQAIHQPPLYTGATVSAATVGSNVIRSSSSYLIRRGYRILFCAPAKPSDGRSFLSSSSSF